MSSARCTSCTGVMPSTSQVRSSRRTIWSSADGLAISPISVPITSFSVMTPTTRAYSFSTTAKSSRGP